MITLVLSYSYTSNNARYAAALSAALGATHVQVQPKHKVTYGSITLDLIFSRKPEISFVSATLREYDLVLLVAPVWMGQPAFPLRRCLDALKGNAVPYGFLTICGGSDEGNPTLPGSILRRTGRAPALVYQQHLCKLLASSPAMTRQEVMDYRLTERDCATLVENALQAINQKFPAIS